MRYALLLTMILCSSIVYSQKDTSLAIKTGQPCPDIVFSNLVGDRRPLVKLSDFAGKAVVIDFWATWCVPCVRSFPKLQQLQASLGDKLQVILVTADDSKKVAAFYKMRSELKLITSVQKGTEPIFRYFPHNTVPHYIWLDKDHIVRAVTGHEDLTAENVEDFVMGKQVKFSSSVTMAEASQPSAMTLIDAAVKKSMDNPDTTSLFISSLRKYDADPNGKYTRYRYIGPQFKNRVIDRTYNYSISRLYAVAFGGYDSTGDEWFHTERVLVEAKDTFKIIDPVYFREESAERRTKWRQQNNYCYLLLLPPGQKDSVRLFKRMQQDMVDNFGYHARIEKRKVKCLVLENVGTPMIGTKGDSADFLLSIYGLTMRNLPITHLQSALVKYFNGIKYGLRRTIPLVNETGISGNIDIAFTVSDMGSVEQVNAALKKFNLRLGIEDRELEMLIISD